jgi:hypothetical protein
MGLSLLAEESPNRGGFSDLPWTGDKRHPFLEGPFGAGPIQHISGKDPHAAILHTSGN